MGGRREEMIKKLTYRKAKKGIAEQYGMNLPKKILNDMGIVPEKREIQLEYDEKRKIIKIRAKK